MPVAHNRKDGSFCLKGTYCSWECMKSHNHSNSSEHQRSRINGNILLLRKWMYGLGCPSGPVKPAPHFSTLQLFGGGMDISEFRAEVKRDVGPVNANSPVTPTSTTLQGESKVIPFEKVSRKVDDGQKMWAINQTTTRNEPLRIKRQKPLQRDQNNLETILGLKRKS